MTNAARTRNIDSPTGRQQLTVAEVCGELNISRSTFYEWRAKKTAPPCVKLPNGEIRIRRTDLDDWLSARQERV